MHNHNESSKTHHELLLLKVVKSLKENSVREEKKLKENDLEIEQLKQLTAKMNIELNELKKSNAKIDAELNEVKRDTKGLETLLGNNIKINNQKLNALKQFNEKQTKNAKKVDHLAKDVDNLLEFAEKVGELHYILGNELYNKRTNNNIVTLLQDEYDKDSEVKRWNKMITEVNREKYQSKYQNLLRDSINQYKNIIFCSTYEQRLQKFTLGIPHGTSEGLVIRIQCFSFTKSICVYYSYLDFQKMIDEHGNSYYLKVQKMQNLCCVFDSSNCLHIVLSEISKYHDIIYLLHKSNESEKLKLSNETEMMIDDISKYLINSDSIVLWLK